MAFELLGWAIGIIVLVAIVIVVLIYNSLIQTRNRTDNAWSQIDVQLKKRANLVPNLVETVKGYVKHERETLESVTKARTAFMNAGNIKEQAEATNMLTGALKSLFAVSENYPDLKANKNFLLLQEELSGIESKIAFARQFYNDSVLRLNNQVQSFPSNIIANMFGFKVREYFEVEEISRKPVAVKF